MPPRHGPKKTTTLSIEATKALTERTSLLIDRIRDTLVVALTRLQKERDELKEFAYKHYGHVSPEKAPTEQQSEPTSAHHKRKKKK